MATRLRRAVILGLVATVSAQQCPPAGWERCGGEWPPTASGYCCSSAGWLGITSTHCEFDQGGLNALDECCYESNGRYVCEGVQCDPAPDVCTGDAAIDAVLASSKIWCAIGLTTANQVYTWAGFCKALRQFNSHASTGGGFLLGDDPSFGLSNIAGLLAQCMWESGG